MPTFPANGGCTHDRHSDEAEGQAPQEEGRALSPAEQRRRFEELSRELGTDNGETLDRVFEKIVPPKPRGSAS